MKINSMKNRFVIALNGTPGTGKSTVANHFKTNQWEVINTGEFAISSGCLLEYDEKHQTNIIDEDCLYNAFDTFLSKKIVRKKENTISDKIQAIIIEGHLVDLIPQEYLLHCFVLETDQNTLRSRLKARDYSDKKIQENIDAENMKDCYIQSLDSFGSDRVSFVKSANLSDTITFINQKINNLLNETIID
jgi:adenylate kinase